MKGAAPLLEGPLAAAQYGVDQVRAQPAWSITTGRGSGADALVEMAEQSADAERVSRRRADRRGAVPARDLGCAARGCTRPPALCDAHHLVHREGGGATTLDNLVRREYDP